MDPSELIEILAMYKEVIGFEKMMNPAAGRNALNVDASEIRPEVIYDTAWQILEVTKSEFVSRSYNSRYNLCNDEMVFESVAAHTNLASYILDLALDTVYGDRGSNFKTLDGYSHRELIEAIRVHDLAENETGDIADNGDRDDTKKNLVEMEYFKRFMGHYPLERSDFREKVLKLLSEMQRIEHFDGKLVYLSDKISALIVTLCLDMLGNSPMMKDISSYASARDLEEMEICDFSANRARKASEMWTIDFFKMRNLNRYDETFFFTAIIVMTTLIVNRRWYDWRYKDYEKHEALADTPT